MPKTPTAALAVLTLINLFNYIDRYVVSALVETLKSSELQLSDTQAGLLMTGFLIVYMLASPIFGALGDRWRRPPLIAAGVALWSVATALGGLSTGFFSLFLARALVGVGEAAYGTIAPAMLADLFSIERRGRIFSVFFSAIPIGSALGFVLGGIVNEAWGWRSAFYVAGLPGLLLAFLAYRLQDPPRGGQDVQASKQAARGLGYLSLIRNAPYIQTIAGYAAYTFGLGGLAFWMPPFLERVRGVSGKEASIYFGAIVVVTGFIGTFIGGWLGDRLLKKSKQAYLWLSATTTIIAAPFAFLALMHPDPKFYWTGMVFTQLFLFASTGPLNSMVINLVPPAMRAGASAFCSFSIHLFGDVPSPPLIGWISDRSSLEKGVLLAPISIFISGVIWLFAARTAKKHDAPTV